MKLFDVAEDAVGLIAIGQRATGGLAIGQMAFGVVAIGQAAFGPIAIGQVSVGFLSTGMASAGLFGTAAMLGVGGRGVAMAMIPLAPSPGPLRHPTPLTTSSEVTAAGRPGWCPCTLDPVSLTLREDSGRVDNVRFSARLRAAIEALEQPTPVYARLVVTPDGLRCVQLQHRRPARARQVRWWGIWALQSALLLPLAVLVWAVAVEPWLAVFLGG